MSQSSAVAFPEAEVPSIPVTQLAPWVLFFGLLSLLVIFFVSADQGAVSIPAGTAIHEWVHDGRHLLAYPCH
jgi:Probable cobalt transporter subunit (CbtB)